MFHSSSYSLTSPATWPPPSWCGRRQVLIMIVMMTRWRGRWWWWWLWQRQRQTTCSGEADLGRSVRALLLHRLRWGWAGSGIQTMITGWSPNNNNCTSLPPLRLRREWHTIIQSTPLRRNSWWSPNYQMMNRWSDDHQITRWSDNTNIWRAFDDEPAFLFLSVSCPLISRSEGYPEDRGCIKTGWQR